MSSSRTATASTTRSSASCSFPADGGVDGPARSLLAVIACGALAGHIRDIANRRGWPVQVHALPAALHNRPDGIAPAVAELAAELRTRGLRVAVGYADCGSYGAIDEVCARLGIDRLAGLHCYDVLGGAARVQQILARQPGTYLLTDYLVRSFRRTVLAGLGLDRHPELWPDYFGNYRRLVWLAQHRDPGLDAAAEQIAALFGLPMRVIDVGLGGLERELARLLPDAPTRQPIRSRIAATSAGTNSARSAMTA